MTLGDLVSGLKGMFHSDAPPSPTTENLAGMQSQYQMYAADAMSRGQTPLSFHDWVVAQQQPHQ